MTHPAMLLSSRLGMRIHGARDAQGRRIPATVHPGDGSDSYAVDVIFDSVARDRTVLSLTIHDAAPKVWTMLPEPRAIMENVDLIELDGVAYKVSARSELEAVGMVEHELYRA